MPSTQISNGHTRDIGDPIQHVSDTSFWIAAYRALESERRGGLFYDPLARQLAEGHGEKIAREMGNAAAMQWSVAIRTVVIDEYIYAAIGQGIDIVLNLGAGLDTRPYRMDLPESLGWIEIDFPSIVDFKEQRLQGETPRCRLERIKLDLSDVAERQKIFSDIDGRSQAVLIITEGLVPYLSNEDAGSLACDLARQAHFKNWIIDYFSPLFMKLYRQGRFRTRLSKNAPFLFYPEDWEQFFQSRGWCLQEMRYLSEEGQRLNRFPPTPWQFKLLSLAMSKERRQAISRMTGYAMLVKQ